MAKSNANDVVSSQLQALSARATNWADLANQAAAAREELAANIGSIYDVLNAIEHNASQESTMLRSQIEALELRLQSSWTVGDE